MSIAEFYLDYGLDAEDPDHMNKFLADQFGDGGRRRGGGRGGGGGGGGCDDDDDDDDDDGSIDGNEEP